jgi:hypothetical protein
MADNRDLASLTGNAATDERTINSTTVHVQRVGEIGNTTGASAQVEVTNSSTTVASARETRKAITILNLQTVAVFVDPSGGTAATTHFRLDPGASMTLAVTSAVTARTTAAYTASGDAKVHYFETYDS